MRYFGVDTSRIIRNGKRVRLYYLEKGASQQPSKVIYDREFSAIATAKRENFDWDRLFDGVSWFHWIGINSALLDELGKICMDVCVAARTIHNRLGQIRKAAILPIAESSSESDGVQANEDINKTIKNVIRNDAYIKTKPD